MIVKDEPIDRLVLLVDMLRPLASNFVIADTGSVSYDEDKPLLEKAGAVVTQIEWRNDFAWARNQTLPLMNTEWTLHLDADEMPSYEMLKHIQWVLEGNVNERTLGVSYFTRNFWAGDWGIEVPQHWHIRMFRTARGFWYKPLHEQVMLDGKHESQTRGSVTVLQAPKHAHLVHSKPREKIEVSARLYVEIGGN